MLDAYIIERIRKQREEEQQREGTFVPARIDVPEIPDRPTPPPQPTESNDNENGSVTIDFIV